MTIKDLIRPIPGVRQLSIYRQRVFFRGSADFWERNYARGETSGCGSYGAAAQGKARFLNEFVAGSNVTSVIEFGCGDGHQLSLAAYPRYIGLDVSRQAVDRCARRFAGDPTKSFFLYDGSYFHDRGRVFTADAALSIDVIYHLVEDDVFETYMSHLFGAGLRYVVAYTTNRPMAGTAPHVRHREFSDWVRRNRPDWRLASTATGPNAGADRADFFVYERVAGAAR
jgi:cyclopropane fatty-acyl-phospholipid synthase-like methyltransferase